MKDQILNHIDQPEQLEQLYRKDKQQFTKAFNELSAEQRAGGNLQFWDLRLNYKESLLSLGRANEFKWVLLISVLAGLFANISNLPGVNQELFFAKNSSLLIFPFISAYFIWKQAASKKVTWIVLLGVLLLTIYINLIPIDLTSSTINLVYIHFPILLWSLLGFSYVGNEFMRPEKRIAFLKYNGNLSVIVAIILLSCIVFTLITFGLFELIGFKIEEYFFKYFAIWAIGAIPVFGTYLIYNNPNLINSVTPLIAKIFTPLACFNLFIYLIVLIYSGNYPLNDRNLLLVYNVLLIAVLALIFFSIAENEQNKNSNYNTILLLCLSSLTILLNGIALFAISYRVVEFGFTPNRLAVLGANILVFIHLAMVTLQLGKALASKSNLSKVEIAIANYLPVYTAWAAIVVLLFPVIFNWK